MDMTDDSLKDSPKRVAKMYVNEIFGGLLPENSPRISTFSNKYKSACRIKLLKLFLSLCSKIAG